MNKKNIVHVFLISLFVIYSIIVVWTTLLMREPRVYERIFKTELFWAFRAWILGMPEGKSESIQYIENVLFFMPFGFLFPWKKWKSVLLVASFTSIVIEVLQYVFNLGWCELDDVISNTIGALIGFAVYVLIKKIWLKYRGESNVKKN